MELFRKAFDMTKADIYQFIAKQKLGVLGTLSSGGSPQSALVGIAVTPELEIIFDTVKSSRKFQNLMSNRGCSFVVGWTGEITVQYEGQAGQPKGVALARYQQAYFARWPECRSHLSWPGITYFVVRPRWIRYSDFDQNPPFIEEFTFETSGSAARHIP
jgi:pyridoxine/pyridoxamine 5'-phosphate oxidase